MQMASWKKALGMALICGLVLAPRALTQVLASPLYDQGMEAFNAGQYSRSQQIFKQCLTYDAHDPANMYMYALCCQKLGQTQQAVSMYKEILNRFPDSAASIRAQSAMAALAPGYLKSWSAKQVGRGIPTGGQGVAPDLFKFERYLPPHDLWHFERLNGRMVVDCMIAKIQFKAEIDPKSEFSYIGVNQFRDAGMNMVDVKDEDRQINRCDVDVANLHRQQFPMHLVNRREGPPVLGQDFLRNYATTVNNAKGTIYLQRISSKPELNTKRDNPVYDYFEVPYRKEGGNAVGAAALLPNANLGQIIVTVYVDNSAVAMTLGGADISQFSPDQIRQINPGYLEEASENTTSEGSTAFQNVYTGMVKIKYMRLGKIDRRQVPARIVETGNARFQALRYAGSPYPNLGTSFYAGWKLQLDDKRLMAKFIREIPKDAGSSLGQPPP